MSVSALAVYAISLAVYALTCGAALGWLDAPELVAAGSSLGIPHSPGHPLVVMFGKMATLLPIGDIAFRIAFASAAVAAGAATAIYCLIRDLLTTLASGKERQNRGAVTAIALGAALTSAFAWALWFQAVRAEVYALETLLCVSALTQALAYSRERKLRALLTFAFLAALAASNHPAIAATVLLPASIVVLLARPRARELGLAATTALLGFAALLFLPVRAAADPALNWGDPSTLGRFLWTISGRAFHKTAGAEHTSSLGQDAAQSVFAVIEAATLPLALLALVAIYLLIRNREQLEATVCLVAVAALAVVGRAVLGFDPETPDHHAYLVPAIVAVIALGAIGLTLIARAIERRGAPSALALPIAAVALIILAAVQYMSNRDRSTLANARASDQLIEATIAGLPPRALVLSAYFETRFQLYAASQVFGARPDVTILDRSFLTYPGAVDHEVRHHPEFESLIRAPLAAGSAPPLALIDAETERRSVFVELHPNVGKQLRARLAPLGAFALYLRNPDGGDRSQIEAIDAAAMEKLAQAAATDVPFDGERAMLSYIWRDYLRLELYCERGRMQAAMTTYARLEKIVPGDRQLGTLAVLCGLKKGLSK